MIRFNKLFLTIFLSLLLSFSFLETHLSAKTEEINILGLKVEEAIKKLQLKFEKQFVIIEPASVARGIFGKNPKGQEVELYIQREEVDFRKNQQWKLEEFKNKKVIGLALRKLDTWYSYGQVMLIRAMHSKQILSTQVNSIELLQWVKKADPIIDVKKAIENKDFTLLAIQGFTWTIPGIKESKKFELSNQYGIRVIEGTSDINEGEEHTVLIDLATEYAKKYNVYLLKHLKSSLTNALD